MSGNLAEEKCGVLGGKVPQGAVQYNHIVADAGPCGANRIARCVSDSRMGVFCFRLLYGILFQINCIDMGSAMGEKST